jgi:hypothetical protein
VFYRVRVNESIRETFVFDTIEPASGVYEVMRNSKDARKVEFEVVSDTGEVLSRIVTDKEQH